MTPRYLPLATVAAAQCLGIILDYYGDCSRTCTCSCAAAALVLWGLLLRFRFTRLALCSLLVAVVGISAAWHHTCWRLFSAEDLGRYAEEIARPVCVEAIAVTAPVHQPALPPDPMCTLPQRERSQVELSVCRVRAGRVWRRATGRATLVVDGRLTAVAAGDRLRVFGMLCAFVPPRNPGEPDFASYARRQRRLCRITVGAPACITRLPEQSHSSATVWLSRLRQRGDVLLWQHVGETHGGLAAALLLGLREEVQAQQIDQFFRSGTTHLLAISGQHVAILVCGLQLLLRLGWMSRKWSLATSMAFVVAYALLTGSRPPVVRAAVLVVTMCSASWLGRRSDSLNTLSLAAIVVLMLNPTSLFDTGAQLSFVAVASLITVQERWRSHPSSDDPIRNLIARSRPWAVRLTKRCLLGVFRLLVLAAAVWMTTLPLVVYRFHLVSFVGLLVNPVVCLPMAAAVFSGFGVFLLGDIAPPLALLCGWLCSVSLAAMESCLAASLQLPYGYLWVPSVPAWWVAAFYTAFGVWLTGRGPARVPLWCLTFSGVWLAFGGLLAFNPELRRDSARDALQITFASLGHGTSVLIELPDGRKLLYDAGHQGTPQSAAGPISALLWSRGIWRLDAVILSHADIDHYNAVPQLLDRFRVDHLFVTPSLLQGEGAAIRALRDAVTAARLPVTELAAPACLWRSGTDELRVLHPPPRGVAGSDNANSLVLFVDFRGSHVLLPGDLEAPGLQHLLASRSFDCDVAMAPHHGSGRSEPEAFAAWAQPEWVIISGGTWRDTSAAARSFGRRGARVFHTAYDGAIRVRCQDGDLYVQSWRHAAW